MNRKMIAAMLIPSLLMGFMIVKLEKIENRIDQLEMSVRSSESSIRTSTDSSISQIRDALLPKNQVLSYYHVEYGKLDSATMSIPVTVTVVPRQYEKGTVIELKINDQRMMMEDTGTQFIGTIQKSVFDTLHIETILTKGTLREVIYLEDASDLWQKYTLQVNGTFNGGTNYAHGSFALNYEGNTELNFGGESVKAEKIEIYSELDGQKKLIQSSQNFEGNHFVQRLDYKIAVKPGQMHLLYADVKDSNGLHYIYPLSSKEGINEKEEFIFDEKVRMGTVMEIRDDQGKVIFNPETIQ